MLSLIERDFVISSAAMGDGVPLLAQPSGWRQPMLVVARSVASLAAHIVIAFMLVALNPWRPHVTKPFFSTPRLVSVVYLPSVPVDLPKLDLPKLSAPKEVVAVEPKPEVPELVPVKPVETATVESPVVKAVPAIVEPPRVVTPAPAPPKPTVGLFPENTAVARAPEPTRQIEAAGFDAPVKQTAESKLGQATVGAFDSAPVTGQRQVAANNVVADSGFGRTAAPTTSAQPARAIRDTGFGDSASRETPKAAQPATVVSAGFDAAPAQAPQKAAAAPEKPTIIPVEVRSKPTPVYTDQARQLKIEGDVVLEVEFLASGSLRVLRVVKGLGYGLDEAAMKAAEQIQFKPAQDRGRAVDFRTTVHIVFRLA